MQSYLQHTKLCVCGCMFMYVYAHNAENAEMWQVESCGCAACERIFAVRSISWLCLLNWPVIKGEYLLRKEVVKLT